jgi:hypothetical protein
MHCSYRAKREWGMIKNKIRLVPWILCLVMSCITMTVAKNRVGMLSQKKALRLIMILNTEMATREGLDALPGMLAVALAQSAAPIITTGAVLTDFLLRKYQPCTKLLLCSRREKRKYKKALCMIARHATMKPVTIQLHDEDEYEALMKEWEKLKLNNYLLESIEYYLWSHIPLTSEEWIIARGVGENDSLFLFLPRFYNQNDILSHDSLLSLYGFNPRIFEHQDIDELCSEETYSKLFSDPSKKWPIVNVQRCFKPASGPWHMYLTGHGKPLSKTSDDSLAVGLLSSQFCNLLKFFNDKLAMQFLFYITCYGGGYHTMTFFEDLYDEKRGQSLLNYTVAVGATTDLPAAGFSLMSMMFCSCQQIQKGVGYHLYGVEKKDCPHLLKNVLVPVDFNLFFSLLDKKFNNKGAMPLAGNADWKKIFRSVLGMYTVDPRASLQSTPLLKLAGEDEFQAVLVDKQITALTYKKLHASEMTRRPIKLVDQRGFLVYPGIVMPAIVFCGSLVPKIISMNPEPMLHYIHQLYVPDATLEQFLLNETDPCFAVAADKVFLIKKVIGTVCSHSLVVLEDFLIEERQDGPMLMLCKCNNHFFKSTNFFESHHFVPITEMEYFLLLDTVFDRLRQARSETIPLTWLKSVMNKRRESRWPTAYTEIEKYVLTSLHMTGIEKIDASFFYQNIFSHQCRELLESVDYVP